MSTTLTFDAQPAFGPLYRRVLFGRRKRFRADSGLPELRAEWKGAQAERDVLARYREATGFGDDGHLPILYPHILTSSMHLSLLTHPTFPLSMLGAVHARNRILQRMPIPADAACSVQCAIADWRIVKAGIECDVSTVVDLDPGRAWESMSTYLVRGRFGQAQDEGDANRLDDLEHANHQAEWSVPRDMGRRYASICGDYNPIHISPLLAKLFGFRRDLIHGMWSLAQCVTNTPMLPGGSWLRCDVLFKGPVFMESTVRLDAATSDHAHRFDLFCGDNPRPVLQGLFRTAGDADALVH